MDYEELRKLYQAHQKALARLGRLMARAKSGKLSPGRLVACEQEIARLAAETDHNTALFDQLGASKDPAWMKMCRELDIALDEHADTSHNPISMRRMVGEFIGTMAMLIVGMWAIDSWRKK